MLNISCGIDFGTSNSSIAVSCNQSKPTLVKIENGKEVMPSAIFYPESQMTALYGNMAVKKYIEGNEGRFMRSLKRVLGTELMASGTIINGKQIKFEAVLSGFIKKMKKEAEVEYQQEIDSVVMGRPVHFRDNDPLGDKKAEEQLRVIAQSVGFKNISFQFEPIAGAYAHEDKLDKEILACVVDIGGGTSDFSIIRLGANLKNKIDRTDDVLANSGVRIGGNDFDKDLSIACFMSSLGLGSTYGKKFLPVPSSQYFDLAEWSKINSVYNYKNAKIIKEVFADAHDVQKYSRLIELLEKQAGHILLKDVEDAKISLSDNDNIEKILTYISDKPMISVNKTDFENSIYKDVEKVKHSLNEALTLANVKNTDIELVVLTGGSTAIPLVEKTFVEYFPNAKISGENKLSSVGLGLAYDSIRRFI